jgi:hypothetical protein
MGFSSSIEFYQCIPVSLGLFCRVLSILLSAIFGLAIGYFALQNAAPVTIQMGEWVFQDVPLYLVAGRINYSPSYIRFNCRAATDFCQLGVRQSDRRWITLLRARHVPVQNFKHFKTLEIGWQKKPSEIL